MCTTHRKMLFNEEHFWVIRKLTRVQDILQKLLKIDRI